MIGDSIPYNAPEDCPGCTAFVDLYAQELEQVTGQIVEVQNYSDHTGLTAKRLLQEMAPLEPRERGSGRGFDEVDVLIFDEAQIMTEGVLDDMIPATNQSRHVTQSRGAQPSPHPHPTTPQHASG